MFPKIFLTAIVVALPVLVAADATPSDPAPGAVFNAGSTCSFDWVGDTSSTTAWKGMTVQLMTGSNYNMIPLTSMYPSFPTVPSSYTRFSRRPEPRRYYIRFLQLDLPPGDFFFFNHHCELTAFSRSPLPPLSTFTSSPHPMRPTSNGRDGSPSLLALARHPLRPT